MKLIAHRGLVSGPNEALENNPDQLFQARDLGFDSEVDLWLIDGEFWLGHDSPNYLITEKLLYSLPLWIHAKNLGALHWLSSTTGLKYFWHQSDNHTLTSNGYIWTYPGNELTDRSIRLMPEWHDPEFKTITTQPCYAICTDWVLALADILKQPIGQNR